MEVIIKVIDMPMKASKRLTDGTLPAIRISNEVNAGTKKIRIQYEEMTSGILTTSNS
jgi:hypothetical protein